MENEKKEAKARDDLDAYFPSQRSLLISIHRLRLIWSSLFGGKSKKFEAAKTKNLEELCEEDSSRK